MSLSNGRPMVAIPGPSVMPDRVLSAMNRPMPNIYDGELLEISDSLLADLPAIARTTGRPFITVSNGHGAWEMAISNTLSRGDKVLVLESGRFAIGWGEMAKPAHRFIAFDKADQGHDVAGWPIAAHQRFAGFSRIGGSAD